VFFGYSSVSGVVTGFADGQQGAPVGNVGLSVYSAGIYWTHFWPKKCRRERRFPRAYQQLDVTLPRERVQEALEGG
jgi:hypothetical protein